MLEVSPNLLLICFTIVVVTFIKAKGGAYRKNNKDE